MIQDYIIAAVQWLLAVALIPTLLSKDNKPTFVSSMWTFLLLIVLSATFASLKLFSGALSTFTVSLIWLVLGIQRFRLNRRNNIPIMHLPKRIGKK